MVFSGITYLTHFVKNQSPGSEVEIEEAIAITVIS
jgi:hypothetical protein